MSVWCLKKNVWFYLNFRGLVIMIHEVKVFDPSGKLKKIISQKILNRRSDNLCLNPTLFSKPTRGRKKKPSAV